MTQAEVADAAGVSLQFINRLESATELPNLTLRTLVAIAGALGCEPHELLVPADRPKPRGVGRPPVVAEAPRERRGSPRT